MRGKYPDDSTRNQYDINGGAGKVFSQSSRHSQEKDSAGFYICSIIDAAMALSKFSWSAGPSSHVEDIKSLMPLTLLSVWIRHGEAQIYKKRHYGAHPWIRNTPSFMQI